MDNGLQKGLLPTLPWIANGGLVTMSNRRRDPSVTIGTLLGHFVHARPHACSRARGELKTDEHWEAIRQHFEAVFKKGEFADFVLNHDSTR